jgi:hypothetical protein
LEESVEGGLVDAAFAEVRLAAAGTALRLWLGCASFTGDGREVFAVVCMLGAAVLVDPDGVTLPVRAVVLAETVGVVGSLSTLGFAVALRVGAPPGARRRSRRAWVLAPVPAVRGAACFAPAQLTPSPEPGVSGPLPTVSAAHRGP